MLVGSMIEILLQPIKSPTKWVLIGEEMPLASEHSTQWRKPVGRMRNMRSEHRRGQADKSARGMPWHQEPMKDVISCDKPRGAANKLRSGDVRMGKPDTVNPYQRMVNQIAIRGEPPELKHLSRARKSNQPRFRK